MSGDAGDLHARDGDLRALLGNDRVAGEVERHIARRAGVALDDDGADAEAALAAVIEILQTRTESEAAANVQEAAPAAPAKS